MSTGIFSISMMRSRKAEPRREEEDEEEKEEEEEEEKEDSDERLLRQMGYIQELYRGFSPFMSFAFCFVAVNVFSSISLGFTYTLNTGGSGMAIWSWIIGSVFTILIGLSLAEICSVYPSAGSVYHWSGKLVPPRYAPLASFICGWFNFIGNVAGVAAFSSGFAMVLNAAFVLNGKSSLSIGSHVGIGIAITLVWTVQNALRIDHQGWLYTLGTIFQILSAVSAVIVLLVMAPQRASARDVFTSTYNGTGFSFAYVCCIGILSTLFSFVGYEAGAHMAEETRGASHAAPKGIVGTCVCSAVVGGIYLLALLFVIPNVTTFMDANNDADESIHLAVASFHLALPHRGALAFTILIILNIYFAGASSITATSRIGFAMARDGIFPFSKYLRWIFEPTKIPLVNVFFIFFLDSLLLLLQLVSTTAFTAIIAICTLGFQISYLMPIFFRCTTARHTFPLGEFSLGRFSIPNAIISSIWLFITSIFMFFPAEYPVTKDNMNYAVVIIGGVVLFASIYWIVSARHWFVGPKRIDIDPTPLPLQQITTENGMATSIPEFLDNRVCRL